MSKSKSASTEAKNAIATRVAKAFEAADFAADLEARGVRLASGDVLVFDKSASIEAHTTNLLRDGKPVKWVGITDTEGREVSVGNLCRKGNGLSGWRSTRLIDRATQFLETASKTGLTLTVADIRETVYSDGGVQRIPVFESQQL